MKLPLRILPWLFGATAASAAGVETDICVYGGTSGGVVAAVQAARQGKSVSLAVFGNHVGGLTSGGLGATDVGNHGNTYIQGLSREFYERIGVRYGTSAKFNFEPKVAESVLNEMLAEAGVTPRWGQRLGAVTKSGQRITQITMDDGTIYRAKMFIDASYEGDLMAMAGVTWTIGRESVSTYGEPLNGIRASTPSHQFTVNVDPYVVPGNPASGLLPFIQPGNGGTPGDGDTRVQAYNYRLCLTNVAANRLPITAPAGYDESRYELLGRLIDARIAAGQSVALSAFMNGTSPAMPNGKTDINNNGAFSTDFIGMSDSYPTASYAQRAVIEQQHRDYIQGFLFYLGNSSRVPAATRTAMQNLGWCKDEFTDSGGWGHIYVREARRMVSDYVMIQQDCVSSRIAPEPIGLSAYTMDSHNCQRIVQGGVVKNEGDVQSSVPQPFGIAYRSIVPRVGECENLLVPWALSASHIAFGSIRMEPVFMILGQSAATAAAFAIDDGVSVQQLSYAKLALQLTADEQMLVWGDASSSGVIVDNTDAGATFTGSWMASSSTGGYWGADYRHDESTGKGTKSVLFTPSLPAAGEYDVFLRWAANTNRSSNVPVDVVFATGTDTITVDQRSNGGTWYFLKRAQFAAGSEGSVLVRTTGTTAGTYVIADAARWVSTAAPPPAVHILASDSITREGSSDAARFTLVRNSADAANALTVNYTLSGTAQSQDFSALSGAATFPAGATSVTIPVMAIGDSIAEGTETLTATIAPGAGYSVGTFGAASVQIVDRPIDAWRHANFTAAELLDPAVSGDTADPDFDGMTNLEEFPLVLNPRQSDAATIPAPQIISGRLALTYSRRKAATDVNVVAEGSPDFSTWGTTGVVEEISRVDEGDSERITVKLIATTPDGRGFLRLRVTRQEAL